MGTVETREGEMMNRDCNQDDDNELDTRLQGWFPLNSFRQDIVHIYA